MFTLSRFYLALPRIQSGYKLKNICILYEAMKCHVGFLMVPGVFHITYWLKNSATLFFSMVRKLSLKIENFKTNSEPLLLRAFPCFFQILSGSNEKLLGLLFRQGKKLLSTVILIFHNFFFFFCWKGHRLTRNWKTGSFQCWYLG
jgi:hypothetical protein